MVNYIFHIFMTIMYNYFNVIIKIITLTIILYTIIHNYHIFNELINKYKNQYNFNDHNFDIKINNIEFEASNEKIKLLKNITYYGEKYGYYSKKVKHLENEIKKNNINFNNRIEKANKEYKKV